jgi:hypothetical protein
MSKDPAAEAFELEVRKALSPMKAARRRDGMAVAFDAEESTVAALTAAAEALAQERVKTALDRYYDELEAITQDDTVLLRLKDIGTALSRTRAALEQAGKEKTDE